MRESTNEIVHKTNAVRKEEVSQPDHVPSRDKLNDKDERKSKRQLSRAIVAPPTREEREERTKYGDISKIRTELSADTITADHEDERLEAYKPKGEQPQPMLMQRGHARLQEVSASSELARNYKIVREGLLPQDRRGRVNSIGGACRKALQELENAAGNHREWTIDDMKRPEVSEIVACYQGFEDLRDDRTMHGPQARALERLVARQRQIDERREYPINGTHSQQVDKIAEALTQGIGTEEIPVHPDVKERIPWATIETMGGPQRVARWLEMYKTGLELPDKTRYAKMSVSVLKAGQPLETVRERHKGFAIKALLEALIILLRSMFKARSPKRSDYE